MNLKLHFYNRVFLNSVFNARKTRLKTVANAWNTRRIRVEYAFKTRLELVEYALKTIRLKRRLFMNVLNVTSVLNEDLGTTRFLNP